MIPFIELLKMEKRDIIRRCKSLSIEVETQDFDRNEICYKMLKKIGQAEGLIIGKGLLEVHQDGYGFLRTSKYLISKADIYVSPSQIKRFQLRTGDIIVGQMREAKDGESYCALLRVEAVNYMNPDEARNRVLYDDLTPIFPHERLDLEYSATDISSRMINLLSPIGKGQRGLIVAPPKAGKTTLLKNIANAISTNNEEVVLMVLLIDERPEEVTDMKRSIKGEVIASTFDKPVNDHTRVSEIVIEKAKRLVEQKKDVVILLDSITRLARAYNITTPSTGQTLSGGVNPLALYKPKHFFGAARCIEEGGSLTILATALVDTGSRMDDVIFEEFKGTGNMELVLDRKLFNRRVFPAIDVKKTSTRREDLLLTPMELNRMWVLRKVMEPLDPYESLETLLKKLKKTKTNKEFLETMQK